MTLFNIDYKQNTATVDDIKKHLLECDRDFIPSLLSYVDLQEYVEKIIENATNIEAWHNDRLVGLIAVYLNNEKDKVGYITNVSVERAFSGKGIASELLKNMEKAVYKSAFLSVSLEVNIENAKAIEFYKKNKFNIIRQTGSNLFMEKIL